MFLDMMYGEEHTQVYGDRNNIHISPPSAEILQNKKYNWSLVKNIIALSAIIIVVIIFLLYRLKAKIEGRVENIKTNKSGNISVI